MEKRCVPWTIVAESSYIKGINFMLERVKTFARIKCYFPLNFPASINTVLFKVALERFNRERWCWSSSSQWILIATVHSCQHYIYEKRRQSELDRGSLLRTFENARKMTDSFLTADALEEAMGFLDVSILRNRWNLTLLYFRGRR